MSTRTSTLKLHEDRFRQLSEALSATSYYQQLIAVRYCPITLQPSNTCWSHTVRYACGCSGQTLELKTCDNRKKADKRSLRPLQPGEVERWIGYYAGLCTVGSEKSFERRGYKCAICKRDDVLAEKTKREAEERRGWMEGLTLKGKRERKRK